MWGHDAEKAYSNLLGVQQVYNEREEIKLLKEIVRLLHELVGQKHRAKSLTVNFKKDGNDMASTATLTVGQKAQATAHEWSGLAGAGTELPLAGAITWASSDVTIATVDASGLVVAVAAGTATITATDAANGLSGSGVVSDKPVVAQSLTVDIAPL